MHTEQTVIKKDTGFFIIVRGVSALLNNNCCYL